MEKLTENGVEDVIREEATLEKTLEMSLGVGRGSKGKICRKIQMKRVKEVDRGSGRLKLMRLKGVSGPQ